MLVSLGAIGFGLVFGWLLGLYDFPPEKRPAAMAALFSASAATGGVMVWLVGVTAAAPFPIATLVALWVHTQWRSELRKRYQKSNNS